MPGSLNIDRADLVRLAEIAAESASTQVRAAILRAARGVERVAFGASHVYDPSAFDTVGCIGVCAQAYGRPDSGKFDGPLFDTLVERHFGGVQSVGIVEVID